MAGGLAASLAAGIARKIPGISNLPIVGQSSTMAGEPWNLGQYALAGAVAYFGPKYVGKMVNPTSFSHGVLAIIAFKAFGGLVSSRIPGGMLGASDGEIMTDDSGQQYIYAGGAWQAMQGLVERSPLDGLDGLVEQSPLDAVDEYIDVEASRMGASDIGDLYGNANFN